MLLLTDILMGILLQRAFEYFNQAANAGNSHAMAFLGKVKHEHFPKNANLAVSVRDDRLIASS